MSNLQNPNLQQTLASSLGDQDSPFTNTNESRKSTLEQKEKNKDSKGQGGRPRAEIWDYFQNEKNGPWHYKAKCYYCNKEWIRGEPNKLEMHLGYECTNCPEEIKEYWGSFIVDKQNNYQRTPGTKKRKGDSAQTNITSHFKSISPLPLAEQNSLDQAVLKAWVAAGIPFSVIENPFVIDLFMRLNPAYIPPSRTTLSGRILNEAAAKIKNRINEILKQSENLTLCKYSIIQYRRFCRIVLPLLTIIDLPATIITFTVILLYSLFNF